MLGIAHAADAGNDLTAWGGRDRAAKVAAAAATIAHGWNRLDEREVSRLGEALEDHALSYLEWISDLRGPEIHEVRDIVTAIRRANTTMRQRGDAIVRRQCAGLLGRAASQLVDRINRAARTIDLSDAGTTVATV